MWTWGRSDFGTQHFGLSSLVCSTWGSLSCIYIPVYHLHWVWVNTAALLHMTRDWPADHTCPTTWFHMFFLSCLYLLPCRSIKGRSPWREERLVQLWFFTCSALLEQRVYLAVVVGLILCYRFPQGTLACSGCLDLLSEGHCCVEIPN